MNRPSHALTLAEVRPEPANLWIRYVPRHWPGPEGPWMDLSCGRLGQPARGEAVAPRVGPAKRVGDLVYLPPLAPAFSPARETLIRSLLARDVPVLVQLMPGEAPSLQGGLRVYDLLPVLLGSDLRPLGGLPADSVAAWPLLPGIGDDAAAWEEGLGRLAEAGVAAVQGVVLHLEPVERRRLAESLGGPAFEALFHGAAPSERAFAGAVSRAGLSPFCLDAVHRCSGGRPGNRYVASTLSLVADLTIRLGGTEAAGQSLFRAARLISVSEFDVLALARDGNLHIVDWLDSTARSIVDEIAASGRSGLAEDLQARYVT